MQSCPDHWAVRLSPALHHPVQCSLPTVQPPRWSRSACLLLMQVYFDAEQQLAWLEPPPSEPVSLPYWSGTSETYGMEDDVASGVLHLQPGQPLRLRLFLDGSALEIFTSRWLMRRLSTTAYSSDSSCCGHAAAGVQGCSSGHAADRPAGLCHMYIMQQNCAACSDAAVHVAAGM